MKKQIIPIDKNSSEKYLLTVNRIANDLNNQANCILINSQIIMDIWKDATLLLQQFQENNPDRIVSLQGLSLSEVRDIVPKMLDANIVGSGRVSEIANLLKATDSYREHFEIPV